MNKENDDMSNYSLTKKPIAAGAYPWGWVDYATDEETRREILQVTLMDDVYSTKKVEKLRRSVMPIFANGFIFQLVINAFIVMIFLTLAGIFNDPLFTWAAIGFILFRILKNYQERKFIDKVLNQVRVDDSITLYPIGDKLFNALSNPRLPEGDFPSYFELRVTIEELIEFANDQ